MKMIAAALPALALAACSFGGKPPKQLLALTPPAVAANAGRAIEPARSITVLIPNAVASIAGQRIPVYEGGNAVAYVKDSRWVDLPVRQFQNLLSETIKARTTRLVLDARQTAIDPGMRLTGILLSFGIDAPSGQAVVVYDAVLATGNQASASRRFEARSPVGTVDALGSARALDAAANQVANDVAAWVG